MGDSKAKFSLWGGTDKDFAHQIPGYIQTIPVEEGIVQFFHLSLFALGIAVPAFLNDADGFILAVVFANLHHYIL